MLLRLRQRTNPNNDRRFDAWLRATSPHLNWDWQYLVYVRRNLDRVTAGLCGKLMLFLPPRHGKSELATIRYPAFRMELNPALRVIVGAYNQTLANKFSRRTRRMVEQRVGLNQERKAVEEWETRRGGGLRAVGVGGGITGQGGDLIIIDDPVKNREEAESQTYRDQVWDWYTNDLYTRREPGATMILIMTRWHKDDLAGRIMDSDDGPNWTVVSLPALAEEDDPLGRAVGEALCPERYSVPELLSIQQVIGRDFFGLYQQHPQARAGGMFKIHWLPLVEAVPVRATRIRWWDRASTMDGGDYTAGVLMAYADGLWFVEDVVRGQWSSGERDSTIRATAEADRLRYGRVEYFSEQEPGSAGKDKAEDFVKLLAGFSVDAFPSSGSKISRADALSKQAEWKNVRVKRAAWSSTFISECCDFPTGQYDDQVDAAASAFNRLASTVGPAAAKVAERKTPHAKARGSSWDVRRQK